MPAIVAGRNRYEPDDDLVEILRPEIEAFQFAGDLDIGPGQLIERDDMPPDAAGGFLRKGHGSDHSGKPVLLATAPEFGKVAGQVFGEVTMGP